MDIFICDRSIFCQFDFRTVEDAGPYNAWKDSFSFLRTYCEVAFLWPFLLLKNKVPTNRFIGLWELFLQKWCLRKGFGAFYLAQQAQRKSFAKRKRRYGEFRPLRRATKATRLGCAPPFEKGGLKLQKSVGRGLAPAVAGTARPRGRLKITKIHLKFEKTSLLTQNFQKVLTSATD